MLNNPSQVDGTNAVDPDKVVEFACPTTTTTTTTTVTTTKTTTTNTHFQNLNNEVDSKVASVLELLEQQIQKQAQRETQMSEQIAAIKEATDSTIAALQAEVTGLKATLAKLAAPRPDADDDDTADALFCDNVDSSGGSKLAPEIVAGENGSLEVKACGGSIALHSGECTFEPCKVRDDLRHLQNKLDALGNL